jgi:hypothetical protein
MRTIAPVWRIGRSVAAALVSTSLTGGPAFAQACAAGAICVKPIPPPPAASGPAPVRRFGAYAQDSTGPAPPPRALPAGRYPVRRFGEPAPDTYTVRLPDDLSPPPPVQIPENRFGDPPF